MATAARFRNFSRWHGLAVIALGIVAAELASGKLGLIPPFDLELSIFGGTIVVPMEVLRLGAAAGMIAAATVVGRGNKGSREAWEDSRVISEGARSE